MCLMDEAVEQETYRRYVADTLGGIINLAARLGGNQAEYPLYSDIAYSAYKPKNPTDYMTSDQIIAYICDKLDEAGDARVADI